MASITVEECTTQLFDHICVFIVTALKLPQTYEFLSNCFNFLRLVENSILMFYSSFILMFLYFIDFLFVNLRNSYLLNKHLLVIFVSKH